MMLQASQLKSLVVGNDHPTVITFDMALYEKAIQLLDARSNLKNEVIPRLGELHVVMAALRTSIENSGIDDAWIEADVYGPVTTRQQEASQRCPDAQLVLFTSDTDVLVLAVAHYDRLCKKTSLSMVSGMVDIEPIWSALDKEKAQALPIFHAFTGADNVGKLSGISKTIIHEG